MWRYVGGGVAALVAVIAGVVLWSSLASSKMPIPEPPIAIANPTPASADLPVLEASEKTREARRFARYDRDRNGAVGRDEYLLNRRKSYARLDTDGDGKLSFDEYAAKAAGKFTGADRDRTGALSPGEFAATRVVRKARPRRDCPPQLRSDGSDDEA